MNSTVLSILNYNTWKETIQCLKSIIEHKIHTHLDQIILIDNNSANDSIHQIQQWLKTSIWKNNSIIITQNEFESKHSFKEISFIFVTTSKNLGFSGGHNLSLNFTLKFNHSFTWILNNDTIVSPNCLQGLIKEFNQPNIGIVGSSIFDFNHKNASYGGYAIPKKGRSFLIKQKNKLHLFKFMDGASFMIETNCLRKIGNLPEHYFLSFEEQNYCLRANLKGYKIVCSLSSKIYHQAGMSSNALIREFYFNRNSLLLFKEFYPQYIKRAYYYLLVHRNVMKILHLHLNPFSFYYALKGILAFKKNPTGKHIENQ